MAQEPTVLYEKKGRIAYVTLNRPDRLNAYNNEMVLEMWHIWNDFRDDDNLWVAILSGHGRAFCAGHDIRDRDSGPEPPSIQFAGYELYKPLIAVLHGYCTGGGSTMALACDIRICTEDARFGWPEPKHGLVAIGAQRLPRGTFSGMAMYYALTGDFIEAREAYRLGLVHKVVPTKEEALAEAAKMAGKLCENSPMAVRATKEAFLRGQETTLREGLHLAQLVWQRLQKTEDAQEGLCAFAEKRKPLWKGR